MKNTRNDLPSSRSTERESGPLPSRGDTQRGRQHRFPSSTTATEREIGPSLFPRGATKGERIVVSSTIHRERGTTEREYRLSSRNHGERDNRPSRRRRWRVFERGFERNQTNRTHAPPLSSPLAYTCPQKTVSIVPKLKTVFQIFSVFDLF